MACRGHLVHVLPCDAIGVVFGEIVVDEIVEVQPAREEPEATVREAQILRDLGDGLHRIALAVIQVAVVIVHAVLPRRGGQVLRWINLILE